MRPCAVCGHLQRGRLCGTCYGRRNGMQPMADTGPMRRELWIDQAGREPYWTKERIVAALQRDAKRRGRAPTVTEWKQRLNPKGESPAPGELHSRPSASMVIKVFGSWTGGLRAAGLKGQNRRAQTRCKYRHPLAGDNLYITPSTGSRQCRECMRRCSRETARRRRERGRIERAVRSVHDLMLSPDTRWVPVSRSALRDPQTLREILAEAA